MTREFPMDHPSVSTEKTAVLLLNLGTPDGTDYWSMRRYLSEFLSDRRIIELTPWIWQLILQGPILTFRPKKSGKAYEAIWNREKNESPLRTHTRAQAEALAEQIKSKYPDLIVDWAMRYGSPSTKGKIRELHEQGCTKILLFPLYPQYSATTTATALDQAYRQLLEERWQASIRTVPAYFEHVDYIAAVGDSIKSHLETLDWKPEVVLTSFHGLPKEYLMKGDPYHCQCAKTARLIREYLGWEEDRLRLTFQSRFGPAEWLQPYTDKTVEALAKEGVKNIAIVSPGFSSDCVETLEEINQEVREVFEEAGGKNFAYIPCLNDSHSHINLLESLTVQELSGWI
jgi:ferrochelatase